MGAWIGFSISIVLLLVISRRNLALGMFAAAAVLAASSLTTSQIGQAVRQTVADPSVWLLAWVVALIPMIGGVLEESGQMDRLVSNLRIGVRPFLALAPALLGMLPMPGGRSSRHLSSSAERGMFPMTSRPRPTFGSGTYCSRCTLLVQRSSPPRKRPA